MSTTQIRSRCREADTCSAQQPAIGSLGFAFYKWVLSPVLHAITPTQCKYLPTCSEYAYVCLARFGVARGSWLALRRIGKCHPWTKGGLDPVPDDSNG